MKRRLDRWIEKTFFGDMVYNNPLEEIRAERARQIAAYGSNADLEDGTGPKSQWLLPISGGEATMIEAAFRAEYNTHAKPTWVQLVREEVAEAFAEDDPVQLRAELVQVAALCCSWIERLDAR